MPAPLVSCHQQPAGWTQAPAWRAIAAADAPVPRVEAGGCGQPVDSSRTQRRGSSRNVAASPVTGSGCKRWTGVAPVGPGLGLAPDDELVRAHVG